MSTQKEEADDEQKKQMRMNVIYKALQEGWSVKKTGNDSKTFEFSKKKSLKEEYKGLVIFSKLNVSTTTPNICDDIQKHLENIERTDEKKTEKKDKNSKRSVSTPIIKNG